MEGDIPVESSRESKRAVCSSDHVGIPVVFEFGPLSVSLDAVRIGLSQGFFFCVQKPGPFLQPEKLEDDIREVEPAGDLQQLPRVQRHGFPKKGEGDRSWDDAMNAEVIQLFSRKIRKHRENLPAFEFQ